MFVYQTTKNTFAVTNNGLPTFTVPWCIWVINHAQLYIYMRTLKKEGTFVCVVNETKETLWRDW